MIVRLMGEGQFRIDDSVAAQLNELDDEVARAVTDGDEAAFRDRAPPRTCAA